MHTGEYEDLSSLLPHTFHEQNISPSDFGVARSKELIRNE